MRHNIMIEGKPVAVYSKTQKANKMKVDKISYIHRDLLGGVDTVTDNSRQVVYRNEFTLYGENISNLEGNNKVNKEDLRGFTGHRQIPEANIINMNARLYDPEIGRFTSADTIIPDPLNPMAYNRYMYVYGNPTGYSDPDGHNPLALFLIGAALFTVGATSDDAFIQQAGMLIGGLMMGGTGVEAFGVTALESGAITGFGTSFISSGGDVGATIQGAITSAISAELSSVVAGEFGHDWSIEGAFAHGATQGFVSQLRGQSFRSGFISGVAGKAAGGATKAMGFTGTGDLDRFGSTTIAAVFGGMASQATGGDFYEGAMRAAFVHLFNDLVFPSITDMSAMDRALVKHFWFGKGEEIDLSDMGAEGYKKTSTIQDLRKQLKIDFFRILKALKGYKGTFTVSLEKSGTYYLSKKFLYSGGKGTHNASGSCSFFGSGGSATGACSFLYSYRDEFADPIDLKEGKNGEFWAENNNLGGTPFWFTINAEESFSRTKTW